MDCDQRDLFDAFPFPPYPIQSQLMAQLYDALDRGHVGLFESPTGTGKTMSLIVGCLTWLEQVMKRAGEEHGRFHGEDAQKEAAQDGQGVDAKTTNNEEDEDDEPDWMKSFAADQEKEKRQIREKTRRERLEKAARKEASLGRMGGKMRKIAASDVSGRDDSNQLNDEDEDLEFLLDDDDDASVALRRRLASYLDPGASSSDDDDVLLSDTEEPPRAFPQIFFVSRTHSQLMQFVGELKKTRFHPSMSLVSLGSRKQLCINADVLKLNSPAMINERCMDLQNDTIRKQKNVGDEGNDAKKKVKKCRCPYLKRGSKGEQLMKDIMVSQALDIEDLASLGRKQGVCPYYAARDVAASADIVLAPYSSLIMAETRGSLGLNVGLEGGVVIVDEAHNLVDAINGGHSCVLRAEDVATAMEQVEFYWERFKTRLSATNARTVQTLLLAAKAIMGKGFGAGGGQQVVTTNKFLFDTSLDNVNMFQLGRDMAENKLIFKIGGYWRNRKDVLSDVNRGPGGSGGALQALIEFLKKLTYDNQDGRIIVDSREKSLKYVMLNASTSFREIVERARSVVLASGTLAPLENIMPLFDSKPPEAIARYSCDHIVDPKRLLAMACPSGPSGRAFDFRHPNRSDPALIADLGRALINVCNVTPGGVVVFFSSFNYCEEVMKAWGGAGVAPGGQSQGSQLAFTNESIIGRLKTTKDVYVEPRSATDVEKVLTNYSASIEKGKRSEARTTGAIIFAVVGGKLAEGINFGDDMGRLVVMVGMPYPNPQDPELQERMRFMDRQAAEATPPRPSPSKEYYVNLCMKAVNQCVGRAIRHINDYAAILLLDKRYAEQTAVTSKLSNWIGKSLRKGKSFGECQGGLVRFFKQFS